MRHKKTRKRNLRGQAMFTFPLDKDAIQALNLLKSLDHNIAAILREALKNKAQQAMEEHEQA